MDEEQPGAEDVDEVVQAVGVCDAVDGGVKGEDEHEGICTVANAVRMLLSVEGVPREGWAWRVYDDRHLCVFRKKSRGHHVPRPVLC